MNLPNRASAIASAVSRREVSAVEVTTAHLNHVQRWEPSIKAWAHIDADGALAAARRLDDVLARGEAAGPLAGVPVGVKDVFDAAGQPTGHGIYIGRPPAGSDSTAVAGLRQKHAIILGKTVTTPFAVSDPSVARNPRNLGRTPGGSSAGSGAAVGAGTIPIALGTQTAGSTLRPALYNGAVGFKPTFGRIGRGGVVPLGPSLDTVGVIAASVEDCALAFDAMAGADPRDPETRGAGPAATASLLASPASWKPRFGLLVDAIDKSQPGVAARITKLADEIRAWGGTVEEIRLPLALLIAVHRVIFYSEAAAVHLDLTGSDPSLRMPRLRNATRAGELMPAPVLHRADRLRRILRGQYAHAVELMDALLLPTASNVAPTPETTGDPDFQAPWTLLGVPSVSVPAGLDPDGLPYGAQVVGKAGQDGRILRVARWLEERIPALPAASLPS